MIESGEFPVILNTGMDPGKEAMMSDRCRVRLTGPLALYTDGFREDLIAEGYVVQTIDRKLRILAHLSSWMADRDLSVDELTSERVEEFIEVRQREGYRGWLSEPAVRPLISYLSRLSQLPSLSLEARDLPH